LKVDEVILLTIHIDGLLLFKSSTHEVWPILGRVYGEIFIIALHSGEGKPQESNEHLKETVAELQQPYVHGINIQGTVYKIRLYMICADAPARAFTSQVKGHNAYTCCMKCKTRGQKLPEPLKGKYYPDTEIVKRTDDEIVNRADASLHKDGDCEFLKLEGFSMVRDIPIDYMHALCQGIIKRLVSRWVAGNRSEKIFSRRTVAEIDTHICILVGKEYFPRGYFARKPRRISKHVNFKATE